METNRMFMMHKQRLNFFNVLSYFLCSIMLISQHKHLKKKCYLSNCKQGFLGKFDHFNINF